MLPIEALTIASLQAHYSAGSLTPEAVIDAIYERIAAEDVPGVFIELAPRAMVMAAARRLNAVSAARGPLWGVPFVVKDNIDALGFNTTAACPKFAYTPTQNATVVQKLLDAGALVLGKTNLDQFATGLVGTRSPYGTPANVFNDKYIAGGSSSGSAVAVTRGYASFALGTDTAGSGRVPAGFGNIVGLKPTKGMLSTKGVVPACASLDCVSVFALTVADATAVADVAKGFDPACPESLPSADSWRATAAFVPGHIRVGVPLPRQLSFLNDRLAEANFRAACDALVAQGADLLEIDIDPLLRAAELLYTGPWVAERLEASGALLRAQPQAFDLVVRGILAKASAIKATDVFVGQRRLASLRTQAAAIWTGVDVLVVPTTPTIFTREQIHADPVGLNAELGRYTNFVNLLNMCGLAVPTGFREDGLPAGVTLLAPAQRDSLLSGIGAHLHAACNQRLGASGPTQIGAAEPSPFVNTTSGWSPLFVMGAHMRGQPLVQQMLSRGAVFLATMHTAPVYKFLALPGGTVARPGLVRVNDNGVSVQGELWAMPIEHLGSFTAGVAAPLGIGKVELADGHLVTGFICEAASTINARDISPFGNWRAFIGHASS
ncbi:MAG: allophanate hydrolase [Deltaproteobacteria bacterium]|nr:allophanate hydrolase [Deltaproteobacteria bacterium]